MRSTPNTPSAQGSFTEHDPLLLEGDRESGATRPKLSTTRQQVVDPLHGRPRKSAWGGAKSWSPVVYLPLLVAVLAGLRSTEPSQPGSLHGSPASSW